jgi:predicted RND superfamily exporter protein
MGLAFMAALVLIYGLIVWEFRNFKLAGLIMSPIPLTLIGIIPGHLIMGAEFTATSMIGLIALGGIIVRQSILIVEFVKLEVAKGQPVREAAVRGAEIRMRPILITSLTLMAGAWAIIYDPIFQGMAVSLLFGAGVATLMAVIVIPLGCITLRSDSASAVRACGGCAIAYPPYRVHLVMDLSLSRRAVPAAWRNGWFRRRRRGHRGRVVRLCAPERHARALPARRGPLLHHRSPA